jgi:predicted ATP-dependent serine protease
LIFSDPKSILDQTKLNPESFSILLENLKQQYSPIPWNALDLYHHSFENTVILSSGCESYVKTFPNSPNSIDHLLGGGIISGDLIELVGEPSSGKSQVLSHL